MVPVGCVGWGVWITTHPPNSRSLVLREEKIQYLFPRTSKPKGVVRGLRRRDSIQSSLENRVISALYSLSSSEMDCFHWSTRSFSTIRSRSLCNSPFFSSHSPRQS